MTCTLFILARFGLLAMIVGSQFQTVLSVSPVSTQTSAWYFQTGVVVLSMFLGTAVFGFYTSLGGRRMFGRLSVED